MKVHGCYNAVMRISAKFTYDDLQLIPPDHNRYEIVEGDLLVTPSPDTLHQTIVGNLFAKLQLRNRAEAAAFAHRHLVADTTH